MKKFEVKRAPQLRSEKKYRQALRIVEEIKERNVQLRKTEEEIFHQLQENIADFPGGKWPASAEIEKLKEAAFKRWWSSTRTGNKARQERLLEMWKKGEVDWGDWI